MNQEIPKPKRGRPPGKRATEVPLEEGDELLTTREAAKLTKMSESWYERKRWENLGGPPYRKRGRAVRYLKSELLRWWTNVQPGDLPL